MKREKPTRLTTREIAYIRSFQSGGVTNVAFLAHFIKKRRGDAKRPVSRTKANIFRQSIRHLRERIRMDTKVIWIMPEHPELGQWIRIEEVNEMLDTMDATWAACDFEP